MSPFSCHREKAVDLVWLLRIAHRSSDERSIFTMCRVVVATVEHSDRLFFSWQTSEEFDEASFIVDLYHVKPSRSQMQGTRTINYLELRPGRHAVRLQFLGKI